MIKRLERQLSKRIFETLNTSPKRDSISSQKDVFSSSPSKKAILPDMVSIRPEARRTSSGSVISDALPGFYEIRDLTEEYKYNNIYMVPITSFKTSTYENQIDSDEETMHSDLEENKYLNVRLREESNFGRLNVDEKCSARLLKKSNSFTVAEKRPVLIFHDDFFFTEKKVDLFNKNLNAYSVNCSLESITSRKSVKRFPIIRVKKVDRRTFDIDSENDTDADQDERKSLYASLREESRYQKLSVEEKSFLRNLKMSHSFDSKVSTPSLQIFHDDFYFSEDTN